MAPDRHPAALRHGRARLALRHVRTRADHFSCGDPDRPHPTFRPRRTKAVAGIGELGYAGMSLESVAAAAGTTVPSLRRRYRNKAELVAVVIGSLRVEEPPAGAPTPRAQALAILENFHGNLQAIPALAVLGSLLAEEERHPELLNLFKTRIVEPRRVVLRQALAAGGLPDFVDLDALTSMLIGSFYARYVTIAGIPDDWPKRVLSTIWPPVTSPAPPIMSTIRNRDKQA